MNMKNLVISGMTMLALDGVYLTSMGKTYGNLVKSIQKSPIKMRPLTLLSAGLCYIFLVGGLNYFILREKRPILDAFLLGVMVYGVFETTSYVMFDNWTIPIILMDTLWGGILFASTTYLSRNIVTFL
jgi:uncharacterized membrane protein